MRVLEHFKNIICLQIPVVIITLCFQIIIICLTSSTVLLGGLAQFLKRRRRHPIPPSRRLLRDSRQRLINSKTSNYGNV